MAQFQVLAVEVGTRTFSSDYGTFEVDRLTLQKGAEAPVTCEQNRKQGSNVQPYKVGDTAEGDIQPATDPKYLPRFKRAAAAGGFGGGGSSWTPEREAAVTRSHSQEMALRTLAPLQTGTDDDDAIRGRLEVLKRLTDYFEGDVERAVAKVKAGQPQQAQPQTSQPPPSGADMPPGDEGKAIDDDEIPF